MSLLGGSRNGPGRVPAASPAVDDEPISKVPAAACRTSEGAPRTRWTDANPTGGRHLLLVWTVWAMVCVIAMFIFPGDMTIPYHLGWAGFALAFGLDNWSRGQLVAALTWYTLATGVLIERSWLIGLSGWDETTEIPLMFLLAMLMVWHVRRRQAVLIQVTRLAELDGLTGVANRSSFNAALSAALGDESVRNTTVLFVDLDDFKDVNDVFGHGAGDDLLRVVAARLRGATRPGDLCARLGGDEFAVLLRGTDSAAGADVAQRIVQALGATVQILGRAAQIGASVGVATATSENDLEQLIHRADVAMYAAKANGKGRIQVFEPRLLQVESTHVAFEQELAVAADNGELIVHYQPVLSLPDGRCAAVEALVRWRHPERGLLYPDSFIEAAERIGAVHDIGTYVLRRACADTAAWRNAHPGSPLAIHVNVSGLQLNDEGFIDIVTGCLRDSNLPPDQLVLEVTETVVISSPVAIERLNILAALGVRIAIDDFGTGYSALTTLRSLPAQIVKIDRSFVAGCMENPDDRAVIEAVVKMAAQMGMRTVAEGVERLEQQRFLEAIGADAVQGFLYLRPTTAKEFGAWLDRHIDGWSPTRPTSDVVIPFAPRRTA